MISSNKPSRGQALDVPLLDHSLLKLLLPRVQSMFKYIHNVHTLPVRLPSIDANAPIDEHMSFLNFEGEDDIVDIDNLPQDLNQQQHRSLHHDLETKYITHGILYFLKAIMMYSTFIQFGMATPAMNDLKLTLSLSPSLLSSRKIHAIYKYIVMSSLLPLLHEGIKWKHYIYQKKIHNMNNNGTSDNNNGMNQMNQNPSSYHSPHQRQRIALQRKCHILKKMLQYTSMIIPPLQLYTHITHLLSNVAAPTLSMKYSGLAYVNPTAAASSSDTNVRMDRHVNFLYSQRRLFYEELMLTCGMIVPIEIWKEMPNWISAYFTRLRNRITSTLQHISSSASAVVVDNNLPCAICSSKPIIIPYQTCCGHLYCYVCLRKAVLDCGASNYKCNICGRKVISSQPLKVKPG
mmetsp:Transcript_9204/g.11599  ORF Transcript_9204/g.11599 Transcript_9204/m.11599 type:complete len:404 (-) Transcript_9204:1286-2497(-)